MKPEWMLKDGRVVRGVAGGGSKHQGETATFVLTLADGTTEHFDCPHGLLAQLIDSLRNFGQMAEHDRKGRPGGASLDEVIQPYHVVGSQTGQAQDGSIGVRFQTKEGIPLTVAMPRDQATSLQQKLASELAKAPPTMRRN